MHFRDPDGRPTAEQDNFRLSLRPLRRLFGHIPAAEFSPLKLKAIRESLIAAGLARGVINQRIGRIKRIFKWAVSEELVNEAVYRALESVDGLKCGRTTARETEPVKPVDDAVVDATLPHLPRQVQGMIRIQRYSSLRPGEVARLRGCELDRSGELWLYKPARHKTAWRGKARVVPIGPRCREVMQEFLKDDPERFLFSPREVREERFAALRAARKTRVPPSQLCRRKRNPKRQPRDFFTTNAYAALVAKACVKAGVPHWHPNQLRHSRATEVRAAYGLEAAQVILGHARANVTEVYAERNLALAAQVAAHSG